MDDGLVVPELADGMAAFPGEDGHIFVNVQARGLTLAISGPCGVNQ